MLDIRNAADRRSARIVDIFLRPFVSVMKAIRREGGEALPLAQVKRVLIIRIDNIGDVIIASALIRELKTKVLKQAAIDLLVLPEAAALMEANPHIARVIPFSAFWFRRQPFWKGLRAACRMAAALKRAGYDMAIDPKGDLRNIFFLFLTAIPRRIGPGRTGGEAMLTDVVPYRSGAHLISNLLRIVGYLAPNTTVDGSCEVFETEKGRAEAEALYARVRRERSEPLVAIFPCAHFAAKEWPASRYGALSARISKEKGFLPVILGSPGEVARCEAVRLASEGTALNLAGSLSLEGLSSFITKASCVIGNDSAPAHIAAALGVASVVLFGPMDPSVVRPYHRVDGRLKTVYKTLPCSFCNSIKIIPARCRGAEALRCMETIGVGDVFDAFSDLAR